MMLVVTFCQSTLAACDWQYVATVRSTMPSRSTCQQAYVPAAVGRLNKPAKALPQTR